MWEGSGSILALDEHHCASQPTKAFCCPAVAWQLAAAHMNPNSQDRNRAQVTDSSWQFYVYALPEGGLEGSKIICNS